jgi:hypothetical protein
VDHGYFKSLYSFDPNGIPIEFTVDVPGRSLREVPRMSDRNLGDVAREGHDPQAGHWLDDGAS